MNQEELTSAHALRRETQPHVYRLRTVIIICALVFLLSSIITAGAMTVTFMIGRETPGRDSIAKQRQTVVGEGEVIEDIADEVGPSVVSIITTKRSVGIDVFGSSQTRESGAAGTGLIIDSNGLILTNKHVVPEGTNSIEVIDHVGESYKSVRIIGRDPLNDLAILQVKNPKNFAAATLADSDEVKTGQKVIAIGNALGQFQNSVTSGIISGQGRPITASDNDGGASQQLTNLFQTDAAINSGNSGGPLLNFNGEVIGINTAIAQDAQNIGFSIPINEAKGIIASVKSTGTLSRPFIGVRYLELTPSLAKQLDLSVSRGAYIDTKSGAVVSDGPADKAGIQPGDIITKVNSVELDGTVSLTSAIGRFKVGDSVRLTILRDGKSREVVVKLEEASQD